MCYYRNRRDRIQVLTVVPSGYALGYLWHVKKDEYHCQNKHELLVDIEVSLGGHAAENLYMGNNNQWSLSTTCKTWAPHSKLDDTRVGYGLV